ncbi:ribosome small subunit-dependent GTPase A [Brachybacterium vulturis]|uniref:Small ribosomal subunit biogenesis GTPase RsgA n=1 Tax=Brachybacterium vulturis TaxID=2017484 RepID=A0A291GNY8_9MICO|nr:ribosome small subunit-dependent GTPase A [Brachybacterium vulturis]ATG51674.1 ribosome small subunit-dependent GTPase A [Brachybacterium vulturis]
MSRSAREYDESDVRVRPQRRGSRPRTKDRPKHEDAVTARVVSVDRGRWRTLLAEGTDQERAVTAMRARELGRSPIVPGDLVGLVGDTSGRDGTLARIVRIRERSSFLRRSADDDDSTERPLVANVDLMVMVTAVAEPEPRGGMIDRCLVAAFVAGIDTLLVLTKSDLRAPEQFLTTYAPLGLEHVVTRRETPEQAADPSHPSIVGLEQLRARLSGRVSVLIGHSGVGKSTLLNALVPGTDRAIGVVNDVTGRGRHTSSSALAMPLPDDDGWVIDTPGVRSFGLGHVDPEELLDAFADLAELAEECPRGCTHLEDAPDCSLDEQVAAGDAGSAGPARLLSYRRLAITLRKNDPWEM